MIKTLQEYNEKMQQMPEDERNELLKNFTLTSTVRDVMSHINLLMSSVMNAKPETRPDNLYLATLQHAVRCFAVMHNVATQDADMGIADIINKREEENGNKDGCTEEVKEEECENCRL